ncbi:MAG TPA: carboxypeptidase regulatory-like domain-containing protein [Bryobacteraceae bacterium]|nr:carboxypeptidase regulatory-like domain-containing protein [Bryobacteraceae bacterium]
MIHTRVCARGVVSALFVCFAILFICLPMALAQSGTTGALTGTVTDPSGAIIAGATVTATNIGTGQARTDTTNANGSYKFSLLPAGNYSVKISAAGFKTSEVASVTVNATETAVLNQSLAVGAQNEQITVESTTQALQTQSATVGTLVGSQTVTTLPLSSRNYTQIIDLSPGVVANVASAAAVGNGTQDINVNGMGSDQNNYMMDGAVLTNYGSGGGAQSGNFPGIGIPNPDSIQEFKVQTSQYDAEYGRNPGASVNVVTKGGTNDFHGDAWEFFRNSALDGNDFFNKFSEAELGDPNKPQILNENLFGGTIGGPIKKDKLFFFGSYQGFRQKNGIGGNGFASGLTTGLTLLPFSEPDGSRNDEAGTIPQNWIPGNTPCSYDTYRGYLGCVFAGYTGLGTFKTINAPNQTTLSDANTNINNVAVNFLRAPGPKVGLNQGFYFPSVPFKGGAPVVNCATPPTPGAVKCSTFVVSSPILANEDQYLANFDYVINSKNTLSERFFTSKDPQDQPFVCLGPCQPGAPENVTYTDDSAVLKLTTVVTSNFVNEASFSYQRSTTVAGPGDYLTACSVGITPPIANGNCANVPSKGINPIDLQIPTIETLGVGFPPGALFPGSPQIGVPNEGTYNNGGNFFASATNFFNYFQGNEQISWNHGKHAIRTGFWVNRIQYNWTLPGRGGMIFFNTADFLTSSSGLPDTGTAPAPGGVLVNFYGLGEVNGNPHDQRANEFASFVEDDIKVTRRLTLNLGLRWEYDGYPSDVTGLFTDVWPSAAALVNTGSFFLNNPVGTLAGFAVQSNYNPNIARCGNPLALTACGLSAPANIYPGYPGGATGVIINTNKTLVHGSPIDNFGPRIGLAWQPFSDKLVVRAGYGIFYDAVYANLLANNNAGNPPYNGLILNSPNNSLDVPAALTSGILGWQPRTLEVVAGSSTTGATEITANNGGLGLDSTSDSEFLGVPLIQQYNLDLQYEVAPNWTVDIGYVGSHGTHLYDWSRPINVAFLAPNAPNEPTDALNKRMIIGSGAPGTPNSFPFNDPGNTNPSTQILDNLGNSSAGSPGDPGNYLGRVSYLGFGASGAASTNTLGDSLYNSLQAQLRHQFSKGLLVQASYTWSKSITNINASEAGGGISGGGNVLSGSAGSNDPLDLGQQYGLAAFNRPQRLVIAYSYDLPFTKETSGFTGKVLGGWQVSGVTTIQDGEPFTVEDSNGGTIYFGAGGLAFCTGCNVRAELEPANTGKCSAAGVCQSIGVATSGSNYARVVSGLTGTCGNEGWINQLAYGSCGPTGYAELGTPCIGGTVQGDCAGSGGGTSFGDSGVGAIMGPGQHNWDMSLIKNTKITERLNTQFRAEFYNVWNHPQFSPPANNVAASTLGDITSSSVPPRVVQFALKLIF